MARGPNGWRICSICREEKSPNAYHRNRWMPDDCQGRCKVCAKALSKGHYRKNTPRRIATARAWAKANPERVRRNGYAHCLRKKYGMSFKQHGEMLAMQQGGCAICGVKEPGSKRHVFPVDH